MAKKKKVLYENESVEHTREELENIFHLYALFICSEDINNKLETAREDNFYKCLSRELESGKYSSVSEAADAVIESRKDAIYKRLGDTPEAAISTYKGIIGDIAIRFLDSREPVLRAAFLPYIQKVLIASWRAKISIFTWWRAVNYGLSVEPYDDSKEPTELDEQSGEKYYKIAAFPYRTVDEMPKKDKEAFEKVARDVYEEILSHACIFHCWERKDELEQRGADKDTFYLPYPIDGYSYSEIAAFHKRDDKEHEVEDWEKEIYESWEYEAELYLPFLISRLDEAIYYAMKYKGDEYKEYLKYLDVAKDWNSHYGEDEYEGASLDYNEIMK